MDDEIDKIIHKYFGCDKYCDADYYKRQIKNINKLGKEAIEKELFLWQYILVVSSGIDGIILSLQFESPLSLHIRVIFFLSALSLTLGVLCSAIVVHDISKLPKRLLENSLAECNRSLESRTEMEPVFVNKRKRTLVFQIFSCCCFALFIILYLIYSFFRLFPELV
ncbi:hypothetical protein [Bacteroides sp.]|uniref:hypothetical protein n=1 Tax=Bacteroides sp. TaxID=29523 RepID=UPI00258B43FC|nr:hypothetical protein [Bacteroides sp.]